MIIASRRRLQCGRRYVGLTNKHGRHFSTAYIVLLETTKQEYLKQLAKENIPVPWGLSLRPYFYEVSTN